MSVLALDTSTASTIVAVGSDDGVLLAGRRHDPQGRERPQHTTLALALAAEALAEAGTGWSELTRIGVGVGPGSFTGLRSGISAATALALRLGIGVAALRGPELIAAGAGDDGPLLAVVDGRRKELFVERFDDPRAAPHGQGQPTVVAVDAAASIAGLDGLLALGDGALLVAEALREAGVNVPAAGDRRHQITAEALVARTVAGELVSAAGLRPAYGREPDAVPTVERERRG